MLSSGTILQGRYQVINLLAQGGMGAVYQAKDLRLGNTVALKETFFNNEMLSRAFEREARLLAGLRHAALPVVSDHFKEDEGQFLVMQFIPGDDLAKMLEGRDEPFPVEDVLRWAEQLTDALDYLHGHKPPIIHRDIKPQNLKLTQRGEIILLDFGLAKGAPQVMSQVSKGGSIMGYTPHYAPLEQMQGVGTDPRSDLYSLAATLYVLLTKVTPPDALSRASAVLSGQPDPLRLAHEENPRVPAAVADLLRRALDLNREARPASADEMRLLLRAVCSAAPGGEPRTIPMGGHLPSAAVTLPDNTIAQVAAATTVVNQASTERATPATSPAPAAPSGLPSETLAGVPKSKILPLALVGAAVLTVALAAAIALGVFKSNAPMPIVTDAALPAETEKADVPAPADLPPLKSYEYDVATLDAAGKVIKRQRSKAEGFAEDLGGGVLLEMTFVPGGEFLMGSPDSEAGRSAEEGPRHQRTVASFYMGRYEVTQAQWRAVAALPKVQRDLNPDPSELKGDDLPVERVSWDDAVEFCARLSRRTGRTYLLPSEAQWEFACRANTTTPFHFGATVAPQVANYDEREPYAQAPVGAFFKETTPVGKYESANAFGLYDMHGNVWEWCRDTWHASYRGAPADGSAWESGGDPAQRVLRGGSWINKAKNCRSAVRNGDLATDRYPNTGLRVILPARRMLR